MITGGWRLALGAAILSACAVVPATAHADAECTWSETVLPQPQGLTVTDVSSSDPAARWLVGTSEWSGPRTAVVWHDGAVSRTLPFADTSTATDVNDDGIVTTRSWTSGKAFKHFPDGRSEELPALPGASVTYPEKINSAGDVVGRSGGKYVASIVVWRAHRPDIVETLPLSGNALIWNVAGIDDDGHVVAYGYTDGDGIEAYVWDRDHTRVQLQPLPGHRSAWPHTIRNGRVIGQSAVDSGSDGTLVEWDLTGRIVRTFGVTGNALSVNSAGHVLGYFGTGTGVWRAADDFRTLPDGTRPSVLSEDGEVSGMRYDSEQQRSVPIHLRCA